MKSLNERGVRFFAEVQDEPDTDSEVFYNPEMRINRDLSEAAVRVFSEELDTEARGVDATAASGIRGLRYSDLVDDLHFCDPNPSAIEAVERGIDANGLEASTHEQDANTVLSRFRNYFHVVDVDPFGPFTQFLDSAARAANHQSLVGLTATDNSATSGSYPKVCRRRYGSRPLRNSFMHETGLRIYIKEAFENFARYDKCFDPKICFHHRHYSRLIGKVTESKSRANRSLEDIGYLSFCPECRWRKLEKVRKCGFCSNEDLSYAGPLWTGSLSDTRFTESMLESIPEGWEKSRGLLEKIHSGSRIRKPYYDIHEMASQLGIQSPRRDEVLERLSDLGYVTGRTHFSPTGVKTEAPFGDLREVLSDL